MKIFNHIRSFVEIEFRNRYYSPKSVMISPESPVWQYSFAITRIVGVLRDEIIEYLEKEFEVE